MLSSPEYSMALVSVFLLLLAVHQSACLSIACLVSPGSLTNPCPEPPADCELVSGVCGCQVCASQEGEACGITNPGCASGLTCVYPTCEDTVQEYVQPDGTVLQAISPCLWNWRPGTCQTSPLNGFYPSG
ncbi:serine protease HTRA1-like [Branchiostoma floridae]|uniref:Serine protease HTRA1-like n=1 Tax=Branchiostoma floridae TaxID=7739 RepID=A0A9J7LVQ8_BRAFL|nr:serine protease HTRA1-like [Branchiostoma floridae]